MPPNPQPMPATPQGMPAQPMGPPPQPMSPPPQPQMPGQPMQLNPVYGHTGMATASLVLGIISLPASILNILTLPIPITAIVLGFVSLKRKRGFAIAGIVLGFIGIILSAIVLAVGMHVINKQKTASVSGANVDSNCFSLSMPGNLGSSDVTKNSDCTIVAINKLSTEDLAIGSVQQTTTVQGKDVDTYLKSIMDEGLKSSAISSKGTVTSSQYTSIDGVRAYEVLGTETQGNYKYFGLLVTMAPKDYLSVSGAKLRTFVIASDSSTNKTAIEDVASSWHWK